MPGFHKVFPSTLPDILLEGFLGGSFGGTASLPFVLVEAIELCEGPADIPDVDGPDMGAWTEAYDVCTELM